MSLCSSYQPTKAGGSGMRDLLWIPTCRRDGLRSSAPECVYDTPDFSIRFMRFGRRLQKNPASVAPREDKSWSVDSCPHVGVAPENAEIFAIPRPGKRQDLFRIEFGDLGLGESSTA
jgi:hypothetical protein